jgi:xylulokinase
MYLMGIDVGTSGVKCILISENGDHVAEAVRSYPIYSPLPGWFEQNPKDWWDATAASIQQVLSHARVDAAEIAGIGLSGQYHGLVILDRNQKVLRNSILWNDQRTALQSDYIRKKVGKETLLSIAATGGAPYFTACKLQWVRDNEPHVYEKVFSMMLPKDYIRFRLTGEFVSEMTDASGTLFLDIRNRKWSKEILDSLDVDASILPNLVESQEVSARISRAAARVTGLKQGTPVAGGAGDQAAAAVGNGVVAEGLLTYSIGTSGVIYAATDSLKIDEQGRVNTFCHAVPGKWCVLACINSAAGSYQWFMEKCADIERQIAEKEEKNVYMVMEEKAASVPPGSDKLIFLPYLAGERHPHTDTNARGVFFGLHAGHGKPHLIRSILEGVAYCFRDCLEVMRGIGIKIDEIRATGGGARSPLWREIQVNVSGEPIVTMKADEGGAAFGACILGGVAAGVYGSVEEACDKLVKTGSRLEPDEKMKMEYEKHFRFFQTLYPLLKNSFKELASL